jgi:hypothetical protein
MPSYGSMTRKWLWPDRGWEKATKNLRIVIFQPRMNILNRNLECCRCSNLLRTVVVNDLSAAESQGRFWRWRQYVAPKHCYLSIKLRCAIMSECNFFIIIIIIIIISWDGLRPSPLCNSATTGLLYQPRMMDDDDCGAAGGMIGRWNRCTQRKPAPGPLYPPQIPRGLTWARTRASTVGSQRLTAWTT